MGYNGEILCRELFSGEPLLPWRLVKKRMSPITIRRFFYKRKAEGQEEESSRSRGSFENMEAEHDALHIGTRELWGAHQRFGIRRADRRHHFYAVGQTGSGKSTLLRNLILQDIELGHGVGLIDPHGDLASELLDYIPPWRTDDLVYFNPADHAYPIGFNLLSGSPKESRHLVASGVVACFKSIWKDSWGPRMEYIFYAALAALLECENVSLLGVPRLLSDARYRQWVVNQVKDPIVRDFWLNEFASYDIRFLREAVAPIQNKVGQFFMAPPLRNVLGQVKSKLDIPYIMNRGKIFIADLSKGRLGDDKANLLGALLVTKFYLASMARADVPEENRRDFHLYIDEFHNFTTDSFAHMLSAGRKYRLCLTLCHQYLSQLTPEIREAVFGNVGSIVSFRVGNADAMLLDQEFGGQHTARRFTELGNHEVWAKLLTAGTYGEPFLGRTLPPEGVFHGRRELLIRRCREKYATKRTVVEDRIKRWMER